MFCDVVMPFGTVKIIIIISFPLLSFSLFSFFLPLFFLSPSFLSFSLLFSCSVAAYVAPATVQMASMLSSDPEQLVELVAPLNLAQKHFVFLPLNDQVRRRNRKEEGTRRPHALCWPVTSELWSLTFPAPYFFFSSFFLCWLVNRATPKPRADRTGVC